MERTTWWLLGWLVLYLLSSDSICGYQNSQSLFKRCRRDNGEGVPSPKDCMRAVNEVLEQGSLSETIEAMECLEGILEEAEVNETQSLFDNRLVACLHRPKGSFTSREIFASQNETGSEKAVKGTKVKVRLPGELNDGSNNTIVFCMLTWPETNGTIWGSQGTLYGSRLVGLSVGGRKIKGLKERVNITMNFSMDKNENKQPTCVFFNFTTRSYSKDGCNTHWTQNESQITCSCDHLTYFGVLMVSVDLTSKDQQILTYITLIGCSLSLIALVITVLLFIINRKARADISMKIHINLVIALILLNVHFFPSHAVAELSNTGLCIYIALALNYSLLASFTWMALEGFHLYLLLVRVFNIYIRKYLLKLSLVGWGVPAVIVSLVVIIKRDTYGPVPLDSNSTSTKICYIKDNTVKMATTMGMFGLVFVFNTIMLGVTIRHVVSLYRCKKFGQRECDRAKRDICTVLGITALLGIAWGLIFLYITTPVLYLFCILNSLQGFFIFLWFVMSLRKIENSAAQTSCETRSTNS